jgi:hypothetical protein
MENMVAGEISHFPTSKLFKTQLNLSTKRTLFHFNDEKKWEKSIE